jgi:hypothetical protein
MYTDACDARDVLCSRATRLVPFVSNGCDDGFLQLLISTCNCGTCASKQKERRFHLGMKNCMTSQKMSVPSVVVLSEKACLE